MSARTTRLFKEARPLFWPWCVVTGVGVLRLLLVAAWGHGIRLSPGFDADHTVDVLVFFTGIPLLATIPFGHEFQHRTIPVLLGQPINRMEVWAEKMTVTLVAVLSAAMVYYVGWRVELQQEPALGLTASLFFISGVCSAVYWTLVAKSTVGGLMLNLVTQGFVIGAGLNLSVMVKELYQAAKGEFLSLPIRILFALSNVLQNNVEIIFSIVAISYSVVMLWLGRRKLAQFQATGGIAGDDVLTSGRIGGVLDSLFRCRPAGGTLNLIRKELRYVWPLWMMSFLSVLCVLGLATIRPMVEASPRLLWLGSVFAGFIIVLPIWITTLLAGSVSLGEERTLGIPSWHMTLPVSAGRQWLVKAAVAMFTGFGGPALILTAASILEGSSVGPPVSLMMLTLFTWLSVAFCCACASKGTVRSALWVVPVVVALGVVAWLGYEIAQLARTPMDFLISNFHPFPFSDTFLLTTAAGTGNPNTWTVLKWHGIFLDLRWVALLVMLVAAIQSYRLFRTEPEESPLFTIRHLLPLAVVAFAGSLSLYVFADFLYRPHLQAPVVLRETHEAIKRLPLDVTKLDSAHPQQLTAEDLAKASSLSTIARRWLDNASITIEPKRGNPYWFKAYKDVSEYFTTIHLAKGWDCTAYGERYWDCRSPEGHHTGNIVVP